jgi:hypothetical protein
MLAIPQPYRNQVNAHLGACVFSLRKDKAPSVSQRAIIRISIGVTHVVRGATALALCVSSYLLESISKNNDLCNPVIRTYVSILNVSLDHKIVRCLFYTHFAKRHRCCPLIGIAVHYGL